MSATWDDKPIKITPVSADEILIIDTEDGRNQKRITFASLPASVSNWGGNSLDNVLSITSNATNPASAGFVRGGNAQDAITWRNAANTNNIDIIVNAADSFLLRFNGTTQYIIGATELDFSGNNIRNVGFFESNAATPATLGTARFGNAQLITWRNFGNTGNLSFSASVGDYFAFTGVNGLNLPDATEIRWANNSDRRIFNDTNGMIFEVDTGDNFQWQRGNVVNMTLGSDGLDIHNKFLELESITTPTATVAATIGRIFMDSNNLNHLSIRKNGDAKDLELASGQSGITASTTQTQGQGALTKEINEVSVVANPNDTVTLPDNVAFTEVTIINNGASALRIFPASGDDLGNGVNIAAILLAGSTVKFISYDTTNWVGFASGP